MVETEMEPEEVRRCVKSEIETDAVDVRVDSDVTTVELFYLEPESKPKVRHTPFGLMVELRKPNVEKLLARVLDEIEQVTSPDQMDVDDMDGFYVITLTYEDGNTW